MADSAGRSIGSDTLRIRADGIRRTVAVSVIPIVPAVERAGHENPAIRHLAAKLPRGLKGRLLFVALGHYGSGEQGPLAQLDTTSAIAQVKPQGNAGGINLPKAKCAGIGFYAACHHRGA